MRGTSEIRLIETSPYVIVLSKLKESSSKITIKAQLLKNRYGSISEDEQRMIFTLDLENIEINEKAKLLLEGKDYIDLIKDNLLERYPGAYIKYNNKDCDYPDSH